ncbi:cuticle collagen 2C-like [Ammospiza nelsoni]|uniref:cuticle collagen 2C-like n=1 Tax=Ammospiza caudacuta TaxID=2857398 RepID=UPI0027393D8D|nr:cuticle collagen 2C-like [Ammospiza caudacuta]XP_059330860.1 cuticle collagen 2C-like [Ammospiza nelsoni]
MCQEVLHDAISSRREALKSDLKQALHSRFNDYADTSRAAAGVCPPVGGGGRGRRPAGPGRRPPVVPETSARWRCRHCRAASRPPGCARSASSGKPLGPGQAVIRSLSHTAPTAGRGGRRAPRGPAHLALPAGRPGRAGAAPLAQDGGLRRRARPASAAAPRRPLPAAARPQRRALLRRPQRGTAHAQDGSPPLPVRAEARAQEGAAALPRRRSRARQVTRGWR